MLQRTFSRNGVTSTENVEQWLEAGDAGDVVWKIQKTAGTAAIFSSAENTWYNASSTRQFYISLYSTTVAQTSTVTVTLTFAKASDFTVLDTISLTMSLEVPANPPALSVILTATSDSVSGIDFNGTIYSAQAGYYVQPSGTLQRRYSTANTFYTEDVEQWLEAGEATDAVVKIEQTGGAGTVQGLTLGQWYNCGSLQHFYLDESVAAPAYEYHTATVTLTFARASDYTVLDTISLTMEVELGIGP